MRGEDAAAAWYRERGYRILARNWRTGGGELDLVVRRDRVVVFCEVKTRASSAFGAPIEAVTAAKQRRLRHLAVAWLASASEGAAELRFDVASVTTAGAGGTLAVQVVEGAF